MLLAFVIWSCVAVLFIILGMKAKFSKTAVGFWANSEPPTVKNVEEYNRAVSKCWIIFGILFEVAGLPLLMMKQNSPLVILPILGCVFSMLGLIITYTFIEGKYRK